MTRVLILGGGGMVGQKLATKIAKDGLLAETAPEVTLFDLGFPQNAAPAHAQITGNVTDDTIIRNLAAQQFDVIFHLASVVSGEAEQDFDKGYAVNLSPTLTLLDGLRTAHLKSGGTYRPRLVFTSSIAVFGGPYPDKITDEFFISPQTSYGAQKAMCEVLIQDYSRKGFIDGLSLRLPTICVRPGKPNLAASSFFSGIIREPLMGKEAILPVPDTVRHWHASPRSAAGFLTHAAALNTTGLENHRALNLPGVSCTVAEQIEALRDIAGQDVVNLIKPQSDAFITKIVQGWPRDFDPVRAKSLGFRSETSFSDIIKVFIEDELH